MPSVTGRTEFLGAAGFPFLTLVSAGLVLSVAGKLQYPQLGAWADPISSLTAIVIVGLAVLGAVVHIGELSVSATPLGALSLVLLAGAWGTARVLRSDRHAGPSDAIRKGVWVAVPFAAMCWIAALVFRIRQDPSPISVDGASVLVASLMWGSVYGAVGGLWAFGFRRAWGSWTASLVGARAWMRDAAVLSGWVMATYALLGTAALLIWISIALIAGGPATDLGSAGLLSAVIYVLAFAPNLIASVITISLGAPVNIGAGITRRGRVIGQMQEHSLFEWPGGVVPWWLYLLVAIPVVTSLTAGFYLARKRHDREFPYAPVLLVAGLVAVGLFEFAGLSDARLGAGLVRSKGVALAAPNAWLVGTLAFVWTSAFVTAGWFIHRYRWPAGVQR